MKGIDSIPSDVQELIVAYLSGTIDPDGLRHLTVWASSSTENKHIFNQFNDIWQATASEKEFEKTDVQKHWEETLLRIRKKERHANPYVYKLLKKVTGIAAAIILFSTGMLVQNIRSDQTGQSLTEVAGYIEITAPAGSRTHVALDDGSKVWLNAGTKLLYSNQFGKKDRNIELVGEAYFSVAKRTDLPFVIQAADIKITALGTAFNVKAYAEEGRVETSLESGSVKIERIIESGGNAVVDQQPIILKKNEKVSLLAYISNQSEDEIKKEEIRKEDEPMKQEIQPVAPASFTDVFVEKLEDIRVSTSWKDSNWIIRNESMKSLAVKLGRRYDVNFIFRDNDLEKYNFSTTLRDETLEQVLNMIQVSAPIKYVIEGKNVYLSQNPKFKKTFEESIQ